MYKIIYLVNSKSKILIESNSSLFFNFSFVILLSKEHKVAGNLNTSTDLEEDQSLFPGPT